MAAPAVRCDIAFTTQPGLALASQSWQDVSAYLDLNAGVSITQGRQDEFSTVQTGSASFTLDNSDGRFTVGLASSPYYPNVKIGRACRIFIGPRTGNLLSAENASFEGGTVGGWVGNNGAAVSNSGTQH